MIKIKKEKVEIEKVISVLCNHCGDEMITDESPEGRGVHVRHIAGYDTDVFFDGDIIEFDICEKCLKLMFTSMKITPKIQNFQSSNDDCF